MKKTGRWSIIAAIVVLISCLYGCLPRETPPAIKIAANSWVGYMPLFYAQQQGYLDDAGIRIVATTSLSSSLELTRRSAVDGMAATQREYEVLQKRVVPVLLLDRSYGGDKILSTLPKERLYARTEGTLDLYMEYESINHTLYRYFRGMRDWGALKFRLHNVTQRQIVNKRYEDEAVVISYEPYASKLVERGFHIVETSKNDALFIIDAVFLPAELAEKFPDRLELLRHAVARSIEELDRNPKKFYHTVEPFLEGIKYDAFLAGLEQLRWLQNPQEQLLERLGAKGVKTQWLR